jgi:DNA-binding transcriptional LysR family regulator
MFQMNIAHPNMQSVHLSQIDLNLLVSLDSLLELRSVTSAARRLGLSQSAMSHQLRRLREMFSDPLLVAGKGGMVPTPRAEQMHAPVRRALSELGRAMQGRMEFDPRTAERTFVIASKDVVEALGLPPMLELISREAPGIHIDARPIDLATPSGLQDGNVDLVIGTDLEQRFGARFPGLRTQVVSTDETVCMMRAQHPAAGRRLDVETFLKLRHVVLAPNVVGGDPIELTVRRMGRELDVAARVSHFMTAPFAVASSDLVVTVPRRIAAYFQKLVPLTFVELPDALRSSSDLVMSWHERFEEDPANRWLRQATAKLTTLFDEQNCRLC